MNTKQTDALNLALEALEYISSHYMSLPKKGCMALAAIEEALAQPEGCQCPACKIAPHASDCPVHNEPAWPNGPCDCGAQPEQEPVAWMWRCKPYCDWPDWSVSLKRPADSGRDGHKRTEGYEDMPLYTSPPASKPWVGLTDEERVAVYKAIPAKDFCVAAVVIAIEAKLREKNA